VSDERKPGYNREDTKRKALVEGGAKEGQDGRKKKSSQYQNGESRGHPRGGGGLGWVENWEMLCVFRTKETGGPGLVFPGGPP